MKKGFTLIELMIVVAIIGILAAMAIPKFASLLRKSREGQVQLEPKKATAENDTKDYQVKRLFTVDGCTVYKFSDWGERYFTNCRGSALWKEGCGKTCTRDMEVKTEAQ